MSGPAPATNGSGSKSNKLAASSSAAKQGSSGDAGSPTTSCPKAKIEVTVKRPSPAKGEQPFDCEIVLTEAANDAKHAKSGPCDQPLTFTGLEPGSFEAACKVPAGKGYSFKAPKTAAATAGSTTKITLELVKLEVTQVTPVADAKQFINLDPAVVDPSDPHLGRTVRATVKISEAKAGEVVHLHLEPGPDNLEGLTGERAAKVASTATTDAQGEAQVEVKLSLYGGDKFRLVASLCEDPTHECAQTKESGWLTVWRRVWYHAAIVEGLAVGDPQRSIDAWRDVFVEFVGADTVRYKAEDLSAGLRPRSFYPRWMVVDGSHDEAQASVVTSDNTDELFALIQKDPKKPLKAPLLVAECVLDAIDGVQDTIEIRLTKLQHDTARNEHYVDVEVPDDSTHDLLVLKPPIQGGSLVVSGEWIVETKTWQSTGRAISSLWRAVTRTAPAPRGETSGKLTDADIRIVKGRPNHRTFRVVWPRDALVPNELEPCRIKVRVKLCESDLGWSFGGRICAVYDPTDTDDFSDTITHEIGHSLGQAAKTQIAPLDAPHWFDDVHGGVGNHCHTVNTDQPGVLVDADEPSTTDDGRPITKTYETGECVMFASFDASCIGSFCPKCHPYVRIKDMSNWSRSE